MTFPRVSTSTRHSHAGLKKMAYIFVAFLGLLLVGWVAGCAIARSSTYPAPRVALPAVPPAPIEEVALTSGRDRIMAWHLPATDSNPRTPALLAFHGNGENLETMRRSGTLTRLSQLGVHVLAVDYPGYGRSEGSPNEARVLAAAEAAYAWLAARYPSSPRFVWGWSLGAAVAAQVAARHAEQLHGVMLLSPWSTLPSVVRRLFPPFLVTLFLRDRYDTLAVAPSITAPTLVIHGLDDDLIPASQGRAVHVALARPVGFVGPPDTGHNDLLSQPGVWRELGSFLLSQTAAVPEP